jgi:hypothetical protein
MPSLGRKLELQRKIADYYGLDLSADVVVSLKEIQ